jgi:hypothetical protein
MVWALKGVETVTGSFPQGRLPLGRDGPMVPARACSVTRDLDRRFPGPGCKRVGVGVEMKNPREPQTPGGRIGPIGGVSSAPTGELTFVATKEVRRVES